jgi:hypothetical protein
MYLDGAVAEHGFGTSGHCHPLRAVRADPGGDEPVVQLVADQRLGQVVQIGEQDLRRLGALRHRVAIRIDAFGNAQVARERDNRLVGLAAPYQALGGNEHVGDRRAKSNGDLVPVSFGQRLCDGDNRHRADVQLTIALLVSQLRQFAGIADQRTRLGGVETLDELRDRQRRGSGHQPRRRTHAHRGAKAAGVDRRGCPDNADDNLTGRRSPAGHQRRHRRPLDDPGELRIFLRRLHEQAAQARAAAGYQAHIVAEQQRRLCCRGGNMTLDDAAGEPPVRDHLVEALDHLGLGHHRKSGQVGQLELGWLDPR